jgi:hypothetical protein
MKKIFLIFLAFAFFGCSETEVVSPETKTDLLTKNSWVITKYTITTISKSIDVYTKGGSMNLANYEKYKATLLKNGELTIVDENGISKSGTWKFINNETQIQTSYNILNIDLLEDGKLVLNYTVKKTETPAAEWKSHFDFLTFYGFSTATQEFKQIQTMIPL